MEKYSQEELKNIVTLFEVIGSIKLVKIKENFQEILKSEYPETTFSNEFIKKYAGKVCYVFYEFGDVFILEDNNISISNKCFDV